MKFKNVASFLYMIQNRIGHDFSYNLCLENNEVYLIVAPNTFSERTFKDNKVQRVKFSQKDLDKESFTLVNEVCFILKDLIIQKRKIY